MKVNLKIEVIASMTLKYVILALQITGSSQTGFQKTSKNCQV